MHFSLSLSQFQPIFVLFVLLSYVAVSRPCRLSESVVAEYDNDLTYLPQAIQQNVTAKGMKVPVFVVAAVFVVVVVFSIQVLKLIHRLVIHNLLQSHKVQNYSANRRCV